MVDCTHEEQVMEGDSYYDQDGNEVPDYKWVTRNTWVDIDLHRYRCSRCGLVRYYSERAKRFYEDGEGSLP